MAAKFEIFASNNQFYFRLRAAQGEIILRSEGYTSKQGAKNGIEAVKSAAPHDSQYAKYSSPTIYFNLQALGNYQVIGTSETYSTIAARDSGIASVKANAPTAEVDDLTA